MRVGSGRKVVMIAGHHDAGRVIFSPFRSLSHCLKKVFENAYAIASVIVAVTITAYICTCYTLQKHIFMLLRSPVYMGVYAFRRTILNLCC